MSDGPYRLTISRISTACRTYNAPSTSFTAKEMKLYHSIMPKSCIRRQSTNIRRTTSMAPVITMLKSLPLTTSRVSSNSFYTSILTSLNATNVRPRKRAIQPMTIMTATMRKSKKTLQMRQMECKTRVMAPEQTQVCEEMHHQVDRVQLSRTRTVIRSHC